MLSLCHRGPKNAELIKAFFPKRKSHIHTIPQEWNQKNVGFFNVPKIGNLYYMNTDQLQYINNHITGC